MPRSGAVAVGRRCPGPRTRDAGAVRLVARARTRAGPDDVEASADRGREDDGAAFVGHGRGIGSGPALEPAPDGPARREFSVAAGRG